MKMLFRYGLIVTLLLIVLLGVFFKWLFAPKNWDQFKAQFYIQSLESKAKSNLTLNDKVVLFESYYSKHKLGEVLTIADELMGKADLMTRAQRVYVAGITGRILRADQKYDFENMLYDKYLSNIDPDYYHLFRAISYEERGDKENEKLELVKAKEISKDSKLISLVNSKLQEIAEAERELTEVSSNKKTVPKTVPGPEGKG